jgi:amidase
MDIAYAPAKRLAGLLRRHEIGCLELLDLTIDRIERYDGALNAVVVRDFDRARARAKALDRKRRVVGPLHGLPITVKESFQVAGLPTTWGLAAQRDSIATADALAVQRLTAAGAIVFGKTNVPVMLADWQSSNPVYGTTSNPYDVTRGPGGSSGGAAAALAAGLTGLEMGSDIGGSIRQPAHACGLFGHKPTWGLCPSFGHALMQPAAAMTDISVIGPLARSAEDLAIALDLLAVPDPAETELTLGLPKLPSKTLHGLRVAIWPEEAGQATDAAITASLHDLARALRAEGCKISLVARPAIDPAHAYRLFVELESAALSGRLAPEARAEMHDLVAGLADDDQSTDAVWLRATEMPHHQWLALNEQRHAVRRAWGEFFRQWDVLICPAFGLPAFPHMEGLPRERRIAVNGTSVAYNDLLFWPGVIGGFHLPATAAPLGETGAGLPYGMQIVGPLFGDRRTIAVAALLERAWRRFVPPPLA